MTLQQAIKHLKYYQKWRRGADIPQPDPKIVGEAIDIILKYHEQI